LADDHSLCLFCSFLPLPTPTPDSYPLSLHDALPICSWMLSMKRWEHRRALSDDHGTTVVTDTVGFEPRLPLVHHAMIRLLPLFLDRKSTRLNSSHVSISYAVFCLTKKPKALITRRAS